MSKGNVAQTVITVLGAIVGAVVAVLLATPLDSGGTLAAVVLDVLPELALGVTAGVVTLTVGCAMTPLCALSRRRWLAPTPRTRFWRCGDCLVLPNWPPATSCTASCRQFASFQAAKADHRELLRGCGPWP